jgi:hypothetical protein
LDILEVKYSNFIRYPLNINKFLYDYKYSKFHECNRTLADAGIKLLGIKYRQNSTRNEKIMDGIKYITQAIEQLNKPYFITSGTLLGINFIF